MDPFALVVHDEESFFTKVVNRGMEEGIFTRDRADEIIRISVAMANKYVLQKEIDFRSIEELAKVQETILKLAGIGLEMKSKGNLDEGVHLLMTVSPVDLFRLAYTRIEKLRNRWRLLLTDHRIPILVTKDELECMSDITCQRLSEMSIFTDSELHTISSITLSDDLFSSLALVEYYENELERYEFILKLKKILPFDLLNRSPLVSAENLSEVDSIREALINTLVISAFVDSPSPVTVTMPQVRKFIAAVESAADVFPPDIENAVIDIIHELGEGLDEHDASLLAKEVIRTSQKLLETIIGEWEAINSPSENDFFKRWSRLVILSDAPDPIDRILSSDQPLDEFDFEIIVNRLLTRPEKEALKIIDRLPWRQMRPEQIIQLFHLAEQYQETLASRAILTGFSAVQLVDLVEAISSSSLKKMLPTLKAAFGAARFSLEDLESITNLPKSEALILLKLAGPPADYDFQHIIREYRDGTQKKRVVLFHSCTTAEFFPDLFQEAWSIDPAFVKQQIKSLQASEIGPLLQSAERGNFRIVQSDRNEPSVFFETKELNSVYKSLPRSKRKAVVNFFEKLGE